MKKVGVEAGLNGPQAARCRLARMTETLRAGFIGLGAMGFPMAGHLARRFPTLVWNRSPEKAERHAAAFGSRATSLEEVAGADVVFSCLPTSADVQEVVERARPNLCAGSVWVDCTSGVPAAARALAAELSGSGVALLDAPVSGGVTGAEAGRLTVMVGGDPDVLARVQPLLDAFAGRVVHVGPQGSGFAVKAVNNALLAVHLWTLGEGLCALAAGGVSPGAALAVINASSGRSNSSENLFPARVLTGAFPPTFRLGLLDKDAGIALEVARTSGVPVPALAQIAELVRAACREIGPETDHSALVQLIERWAGVELRGEVVGT